MSQYISRSETTASHEYTIVTECGTLNDFVATNLTEAKEIYERKNHYDFNASASGSYYRIFQDGQQIEVFGRGL